VGAGATASVAVQGAGAGDGRTPKEEEDNELTVTVREAEVDDDRRPEAAPAVAPVHAAPAAASSGEEENHGLPLHPPQSNVLVQHTHAITDGVASRLCRARLQLGGTAAGTTAGRGEHSSTSELNLNCFRVFALTSLAVFHRKCSRLSEKWTTEMALDSWQHSWHSWQAANTAPRGAVE